jgi:hypothetical protein
MRITTTYRKVGVFYIACIGDFATNDAKRAAQTSELLIIREWTPLSANTKAFALGEPPDDFRFMTLAHSCETAI